MRMRVKFSKHGPIRFIGHLDLMRYFQKVNRRADLPVKYSEGFNPHQLLTFALPLSVGMQSDGEYLEIQFAQELSAEEVLGRMNAEMHEGITALTAKTLTSQEKKAMTAVFACAYEVSFREELQDKVLENRIAQYLNQTEIPVEKKTKKGFTNFNIRPFIYQMKWLSEKKRLFLLLKAGSENHVKPSLLMSSFLGEMSSFLGETISQNYGMLRKDIFTSERDDNGLFLVPLISSKDSEKIYLNENAGFKP